ncbi:MAG: single-stranded DNA-binding protein [Saprospiraceae bacterium]|nr:single-stranded DNA-binding protein [Saprospiraceae bacterium]
MSNLRNSIQLIGNLGRDPEVHETSTGKKVARVTIATNESYKNKDGERVQKTEWHNLVAWGGQAAFFENYLQKGSLVGIRGKIAHRKYEGKDGLTKTFTEVIVNEVINLTPREVAV